MTEAQLPLTTQIREKVTQTPLDRFAIEGVFKDMVPSPEEFASSPIAQLDLAQAQGKDLIRGLVETDSQWKAALVRLASTYHGEEGREEEMRVLRAISIALPSTLQAEAQAHMRTPEQESEFVQAVRDYVADQALVELTDPTRATLTYDRSYFDQRHYHIARDVLQTLGLSESILGQGEEVANHRARQRTYTETLVLRWLQKTPLELEYTGRYHNYRRKGIFSLPDSVDETTRQRYASALAMAVDGLDQQVTWRAEEYEQRIDYHRNPEPIRTVHEFFTSRLFQGLQHEGGLQPGSDLAEIADSDHPQEIASFARGVAIKTLVEGGDTITYATALGALQNESPFMAAVAVELWRDAPEGSSLRQNLAEILVTCHPVELQQDPQLRDALYQQLGEDKVSEIGKAKADQTLELARQQLKGVVTAMDLSQDYRGEFNFPNVHRAITESTIDEARKYAALIARQMIYGQAVSYLAVNVIRPQLGAVSAGEAPLSALVNQVNDLREALQHSYYLRGYHTPEQRADGSTYQIPEQLRHIVYAANFVKQLLRFPQDQWNLEREIREYFEQAQSNGISRQQLVHLHNEVALGVVAANVLIDKQLGADRYGHNAINFYDVLMKLGSNIVKALPAEARFIKGFSGFDASGRPFEGFNLYRTEEETDQFVEPYQREQLQRRVQRSLQTSLGTLLIEGGRLKDVNLLLQTERWLRERQGIEELATFAIRNTKIADSFRGLPEYVAAIQQGEQVGQAIADIDRQLQGLDEDTLNARRLGADIHNWFHTQYDRIVRSSLVAGLRFSLGRGEPAIQRKQLEARIQELTGQKVDIVKDVARVDLIIDEWRKRKVNEQAEAAVARLREVISIPTTKERVASFLSAHTTPSYNPDDPKQVIQTVKIPGTQTTSTGPHTVMVEVPFTPQGLEDQARFHQSPIIRLFDLFALLQAVDGALSNPVAETLAKLRNHRPSGYEPGLQVLREAVDEQARKIASPQEALQLAGQVVKQLLLNAVRQQIREVDPSHIQPEKVAGVAGGRFVPLFRQTRESLERDINYHRSNQ